MSNRHLYFVIIDVTESLCRSLVSLREIVDPMYEIGTESTRHLLRNFLDGSTTTSITKMTHCTHECFVISKTVDPTNFSTNEAFILDIRACHRLGRLFVAQSHEAYTSQNMAFYKDRLDF